MLLRDLAKPLDHVLALGARRDLDEEHHGEVPAQDRHLASPRRCRPAPAGPPSPPRRCRAGHHRSLSRPALANRAGTDRGAPRIPGRGRPGDHSRRERDTAARGDRLDRAAAPCWSAQRPCRPLAAGRRSRSRDAQDHHESTRPSSSSRHHCGCLLAPGRALAYIFKAAQARSDRCVGPLLFLVVLGPVLFAAQGVSWRSVRPTLRVSSSSRRAASGTSTRSRRNLLEDNGARARAGRFVDRGARDHLRDGLRRPSGRQDGAPHPLSRHPRHGARRLVHPASAHPDNAARAPRWFMYFGLMLAGRNAQGPPARVGRGRSARRPAPGRRQPRCRRSRTAA